MAWRYKQLKNSPQIRTLFLFRSQFIQKRKTSRRVAKEAKGGKMNPGMPKGEAPKLFLGVHARLVFPDHRDEAAVLDLMRRFSSATRFAYQRLLEGKTREELKRESGPLCTLFGLNTRYADGVIEKAQATLDSAKELGQDPRKVVFGGRKLFEQLKRKHLSGKALLALKREWKEKRQGLLYSRGDATKKGNANLRLESRDGALWLRVNLGNGGYVQALVQTAHPQLNALRERVYASLPYNVTLQLKEGKVYAHFTWSEELPPPVHTKANGVLGVDVNGDPYHLALAVVSPDGNLVRYLTLSLEGVDSAPNKGAKELLLWRIAHQVVAVAEEHGVAIATEKLKRLRNSRRGDGSGRHFRRKQHRFAYRSLLAKVHSLARKRGVEVLEVNPQDTSTIGMLKYAPQLHLSKDVAAAYVIGRRALGFEEKLPKGYRALLRNKSFLAYTEGFYQSRLQELQKLREAEGNPYLRRRLSRDIGKAKAALTLVSSLQGSPGSRKGVTEGRNPSGAHPWRVLRVSLFLPLLGLEVPRDLSPLKPILHGLWEGWKVGSGPHPGGGPGCANVHFY
ncbi:transposase, IS605 family, OrfB [Thermus aquaticus Y51MC23]|uniref:Transposase, IS605 family, OrfB n=2 Tax=Thermus aquaticus TaxID=271 RepID=A0ABN4IHN0_THEA5|nr:transposase, IS605 family, OrfB [Thermus aquaticus Y51MC23]